MSGQQSFDEAVAQARQQERQLWSDATDMAAQDFWERCVLACLPHMARQGESQIAAEVADILTAEWRKRFDPREKK